MGGKLYEPSFRLKVAEHYINNGGSYGATAKAFGCKPGNVHRWVNAYNSGESKIFKFVRTYRGKAIKSKANSGLPNGFRYESGNGKAIKTRTETTTNTLNGKGEILKAVVATLDHIAKYITNT